MTFAENRTYGVPEFAGTEVNRHSGKLKGLSGYLQNHYPTPEVPSVATKDSTQAELVSARVTKDSTQCDM